MPNPYENMTMNADLQSQAVPAHSHFIPQNYDMPVSAGVALGFELDENNQHYFPHVQMFPQHIGVTMHDRRMSQPELRVQTGMRPLTPTQQIQSAQFPLTPAQTPYRMQSSNMRTFQSSPVHHFQDDSIKSPFPVSMQKSKSLQGIVEQDELHHEASNLPTSFDAAEMPDPTSFVWSREPQKQAANSSIQQETAVVTPGSSDDEPLPFFDEYGGQKPDLSDLPIPVLSTERVPAGSLSPSRPALSPRRMSISDLNLDPGISASIEETNVTLDDIAQYIEGPNPSDNKWVCRFTDCNKRFGRKENIKSHVQTHLGDRQFRCNHCKKCFVRGHDLKRHAKIHTGTKPYPCLCGNAFARHDALTRHRQRGMCIGAFDGIVKKVIKRGRPRKHRPEMDERLEKAGKSRSGPIDGQDQYASSASSCSMSSWGSPPTETMDALSIQGQSPYDEVDLFDSEFPTQSSHHVEDIITLPPNMFTFTPPTSPGYSTGNRPSPSYRELSPVELAQVSAAFQASGVDLSAAPRPLNHTIPVLDQVHTNSVNLLSAKAMALQHSQQSLPALSHSSSSPAPELTTYDFSNEDPALSMTNVQSLNFDTISNVNNNAIIKLDMLTGPQERNDFDNFLDFSGVDMGFDGNTTDSFFAI